MLYSLGYILDFSLILAIIIASLVLFSLASFMGV